MTLTAALAFVGRGGNAHRKGVIMMRQSLDTDSSYADIAMHGEGLTSLQARDTRGSRTHEVQSNVSAPRRVRIEKHGDYFYTSVAGDGEELRFAGGSMKVVLKEPFYVGLGVCAHNKDAVETVVFSNVTLSSSAPQSVKGRRSTAHSKS